MNHAGSVPCAALASLETLRRIMLRVRAKASSLEFRVPIECSPFCTASREFGASPQSRTVSDRVQAGHRTVRYCEALEIGSGKGNRTLRSRLMRPACPPGHLTATKSNWAALTAREPSGVGCVEVRCPELAYLEYLPETQLQVCHTRYHHANRRSIVEGRVEVFLESAASAHLRDDWYVQT